MNKECFRPIGPLLFVLFFVLQGCFGAAPARPCGSDLDCLGNESCSSGACSPKATLPEGCTKDIDCKGNRICKSNSCIAPPPDCTRAEDCQSGQTCQGGRCVAVSSSRYALGAVLLQQQKYKTIPTATPPSRGSLPTSKDLSPFLPPVGDQGSQGSCVAWAVAYGLKSYQVFQRNQASYEMSTLISPASVYNQIKVSEDCLAGSHIFDAMELLRSKGACSLQNMPYQEGSCSEQLPKVCQEELSSFRFGSWKRANHLSETDLKSFLASSQPVVIAIDVHQEFFNLSARNPVLSSISGKSQGGHAILLAGYDDSRGAFKIMNSWGRGWGDQGYGWISYAIFKQITREAYVADDLVPKNCASICTGFCGEYQGCKCNACPNGQNCVQNRCKQQSSCGNGSCDNGETCSSCPQDCACSGSQVCSSGRCTTPNPCGNGRCDSGETCSSCPQDCRCPGSQVCSSGRCTTPNPCGNGRCDSGETCSSCPQDCRCPSSQLCRSGRCEPSCTPTTSCSSSGTRIPSSSEAQGGGRVLALRLTSSHSCGQLQFEVTKSNGSFLGSGKYILRVGSCRSFGAIRASQSLSGSQRSIRLTTDHRGTTGTKKEFCVTKDASTGAQAWWWSNLVIVNKQQTGCP